MDWALCIDEYVGKFDPLKLAQIRRLTLAVLSSGDDSCSSIELTAVAHYWPSFLIDLRLSGIASLKIPDIEAGGMIGFAELSIGDISDFGLKSLRYRLIDNLTGFYCECSSIHISNLSEIQDGGSIKIIRSFN